MTKFSRSILRASITTLLTAASASAANLTWDITPGGTTTTGSPITGDGAISGGAGTWNNSTALWTTDGGFTDNNWDNVLNAGDTAVFQVGSGTVTLGNAIDLAGLTFLSTGYTVSAQSLVFGSAQGSINTSGLSAAGVTTISAALVGTGGLTLAGNGDLSANGGGSSGLLSITGSNINLTGGISITSGLVSFGSSSAAAGSILGTAGRGNTLTISNQAGIVGNSTLTLGNNIVFAGGVSTLRAYGAVTLTLNGAISGTGGFNKTDGGIVALNNSSNSFSGPVSIQDGTVSITSIKSMGGGASALGSIAAGDVTNGTINIGSTTLGATLVYTGKGDTTDRVINLAGTTGGATLTQSGSGQLILTGSITATGTGGAKTLTLNGSTAGTGEIAGSIFDSIGGLTSVTKSGTGLWTLSGTSIYTGATTVSAGTLNLTGSLTSAITVASGAILTGSGSTSNSITLSSGSNLLVGNGVLTGSTVSATSVNVIPLASAVTATSPTGTPNNISIIGYTTTSPGTSGFNVSTFRNASLIDTGSMIALSYTAATRSWAGSSGSWDNGTSLSWVEGDQLFYSGDAVTFGEIAADNIVSLAGTVAPSRITVSNATGAYTFSGTGSIVGSTGLTMNGTNSLNITTSNTYSGGTTITAGSIIAGSATALGTGTVSIGASGTLNVGAFTLANTISGSGTITSTVSTGSSQLNGDLSGFTGTLNVNTTAAGKFAVQGTAPFATSATINIATGATFYASGPLNFTNNFNLSGTGNTENLGALRLDSGATVSGNVALQSNASIGSNSGTGQISGVISESTTGTTVTKQGAGIVALTAANTYSGGTIISAGTLALRGGDNRLLANSTLLFNGAGTLDIGSTNQVFTASNLIQGITGSSTDTITGSGSLTFNSANLTVQSDGSMSLGSTRTLDMTNLANFIYNDPAGAVVVGGTAINQRNMTWTWGGTTSITASTFYLGQNYSTQSGANASAATINLGQTNTIDTDTFTVGVDNRGTNGGSSYGVTLAFRSGLINPTLKLRGSDGVSAIGTWNVGARNSTVSQTSIPATSVNLSSGTLDALVTNLNVGQLNGGSIALTTTFTMGAGTLNATTIDIGNATSKTGSASSGANTTSFTTAGNVFATTLILGTKGTNSTGTNTATFNLNAGSNLNVGTLTIGNTTGGSGTNSATFNFNGGTLAAQTIQSGSGTATRAFNWNSGTIQNQNSSTSLSVSTPITLAATGTHTFDISAAQIGNVSGVIGEAAAGGSLVKSDNGTLILSAVNTYTGTTTVNGGTLIVSGQISGSTSTINGGTLSGTGTTGAVIMNPGGTILPGLASATGTLNTGSIVFNGGGTFALTINTSSVDTNGNVASGLEAITGELQLGSGTAPALTLSDLGSNVTLSLGDKITLATYTGGWDGNFFSYNGTIVPDGGTISFQANKYQLNYNVGSSVVLTVIPEPATVASLLSGLGMLAGLRRFRRRETGAM